MKSVKMSVQAFYDCKNSLEEKGMIEVKKGKDDYDITFCGNDFSMYTEEGWRCKISQHKPPDFFWSELEKVKTEAEATGNGSFKYQSGR